MQLKLPPPPPLPRIEFITETEGEGRESRESGVSALQQSGRESGRVSGSQDRESERVRESRAAVGSDLVWI